MPLICGSEAYIFYLSRDEDIKWIFRKYNWVLTIFQDTATEFRKKICPIMRATPRQVCVTYDTHDTTFVALVHSCSPLM